MLFWAPLALTWLMMTAGEPILLAFIARMPDAKNNLAAFGIAMAFALIIEAPVIMLMSASTALVTDKDSYQKLKKFTDILNISVTVLHVIILIPPLFNFLVIYLMGVPENIAQLTYVSLILLIPWSAAIGYRRFLQGILIRNNLTSRVTYGTIVRLAIIAILGTILFILGVKGSYIGAASLSLAVIVEAIATRLMAAKTIRGLLSGQEIVNSLITFSTNTVNLTYKSITKFYSPLALTSLLSLGVHPFVTFFLGKSLMAIESLAVLPVVSSLVFLFRSVGLSSQEVNIALVGEQKQNFQTLKIFAIILGFIVTALLTLIAFTPLAKVWFIKVSGLTPELANLSFLPLKVLIFLPALTVMLSFQRSILVISNATRHISTATGIELLTIILVLLICVVYLNLIGVLAACIAFVIGKSASNLYLIRKCKSEVRKW